MNQLCEALQAALDKAEAAGNTNVANVLRDLMSDIGCDTATTQGGGTGNGPPGGGG